MDDYRNEHPIGIMPKWIYDEHRYSDLVDVIDRYLKAGLPIDPLWIDEYNELHKRIDERQSKGESIHKK